MDQIPDQPGALERLKRLLYKRNAPDFHIRRTPLPPQVDGLAHNWAKEDLRPGSSSSFASIRKILFGSFLFFVAAVVIAGSVVWLGGRSVSNSSIQLLINGPSTVRAGSESSFQILIVNLNNAPLDQVDLIVNWPPGTRAVSDPNQNLTRVRERLEPIGPGETVNKTVRARVFGTEQSEQPIEVELEYRIASSTNLFRKSQTYKLVIGDAPIALGVDIPAEVNSGQEIPIEVTVGANTDDPLKNVLLSLALPPGVTIRAADRLPIKGETVWELGDLPPGESVTINLRGLIDGQEEEVKTFRFEAGVADNLDPQKMNLIYNQLNRDLVVRRPFLDTALAVNDQIGDYVASFGERLNVVFAWTNRLAVPLSDAEVTIRFEGDVFDQASVTADRGFYRSDQNRIILDKTNEADLEEIPVGGQGNTSFSLVISDPASSGQSIVFNQPEIVVIGEIRARRTDTEGAGDQILSTTRQVIKVGTQVGIRALASYVNGPFTNTGPKPPQINQETTYTLNWQASNYSSAVDNAAVKVVLPQNVRWLNKVSPASETVTYNPTTREVLWYLGTLPAGTGVTSEARGVFFQVGLTPSASQLGSPAVLLPRAVLSAIDSFTGRSVSVQSREVDTRINSDSGYKSGDENVVR